MTSECFDALTTAHIPQLAGSVDTSSQAIVSRKVELPARQLPCVALQSKDALASTHVPDLGCVVE